MVFNISCPSCGHTGQVPDHYADQTTRCPNCKSSLDSTITAQTVSRWMFEEFEKKGKLSQSMAVAEIEIRFGERFIHRTSGSFPGVSIKPAVLQEFRRLTEGKAKWVSQDNCWHRR